MVFKPLERNNIKVYTSLNHKKKLIIFFPSAATSYDDYKNFMDNITASVDFVYVSKGYNGLITNDKSYKPFGYEEFTRIFINSFKSLMNNYEKVILLGQSFGSCVAYEIYKSTKNAKLILVAPAFSEKSFKYGKVGKIFLDLMTDTFWGKKITNFLEPSFLRLCNKLRLNSSQQLFVKALRRSGTINYFSCLRETLRYGLIDKDILSEDVIMVFGKRDPFLNNFCNQVNFHKRKNSYFLDHGHTILQKEWEFILKFI